MPGHLTTSSGKKLRKLGNKKIGIVVAEWNAEVTEALYEGALSTLIQSGLKKRNVQRLTVPGSFELPLGAQWLAGQKDIDGVIALGCVIQGDTPHFDYICQAVAQGLMDVNLKFGKPVAFGVLTTLNKKQAEERAGGRLGNKGEEAAITVMEMLSVRSNRRS